MYSTTHHDTDIDTELQQYRLLAVPRATGVSVTIE